MRIDLKKKIIVLIMTYKLKFKREKEFLYASIIGDRNLESIKPAKKEICEICINKQCSKVLVDVRDYTEHIGVFDICSLAAKELPDIIEGDY
jgi:hypothetical protein